MLVPTRARVWFVVATTITAGCGATGSDAGESGGSSTGAIDLPTPDFLEPASGELTLPTTRTMDVLLDVNADRGVTRLELDGRSVGTLTSPSSIGALGDGVLQLYTRGAMVAGIHTLAMRTPDRVQTGSSETVTVFITSSSEPQVRWEPGAMLDVGDAIVGSATGVLGLVVADDVAHLRAWPPGADGWDLGRPRDVALPGHVIGDAGRGGPALALGRVLDDDRDRLRVAWRIGIPGSAIDRVEVDWDATDDGTPVRAFVPDPAWLGAREWTEIGRPVLAGDVLLAEIVAQVDTELAHPGDHTLARTPWAAAPSTMPQLVALGPIEADGAAPAVDTLPSPTIAIGLRLGGTRPVVLDVDPDTSVLGLRPSDAVTEDPRWADVAGPIVTTLGAFGSRVVAGLHRDGDAVLIASIIDRGGNAGVIDWVELPDDAPVAAPLAAAVVDGVVVLLLPRGDAEMIAIAVSSESPALAVLPGAYCDAVVAPPRPHDVAADHAAIACLRERVLSVGAVVVE